MMYNLLDMTKETKLLASDLDGTLFYPKRPRRFIARKNKKFLDRFVSEGNKVVFVTGRSPNFANKVVNFIGHDIDVIGMNGAYTIVDGKVKDEHFLDFPIGKVLYELNFLFPSLGQMLISRKHPLLISIPPMGKIMELFYRIYYLLQGEYAEEFLISNEEFVKEIDSKEVYKIMIFFGLSKRGVKLAAKANSYLRKNYAGQFESSWTGGFIEITPMNSSKAQGIEKYINEKGFKHENVYVVGDSGNDISMFNAYHDNSFCLKHAHKKVKKYAKTIIRRFHHLEKYM